MAVLNRFYCILNGGGEVERGWPSVFSDNPVLIIFNLVNSSPYRDFDHQEDRAA